MQTTAGTAVVDADEAAGSKRRPSLSDVHSSFSTLLRAQHAELLARFDELIALQTNLLGGIHITPGKKAGELHQIAPAKPPPITPPPPMPTAAPPRTAGDPRVEHEPLLPSLKAREKRRMSMVKEETPQEATQEEVEPEPTTPTDAKDGRVSTASVVSPLSPDQSNPLTMATPAEERRLSVATEATVKEPRSSTLTEINNSDTPTGWSSTASKPRGRTSLVSTVSKKASKFMARMSRADLDDIDHIEWGRLRTFGTGMALDISSALNERRAISEQPGWRRFLRMIVMSDIFEATFAILIVFNVACVGVQVEIDAQSRHHVAGTNRRDNGFDAVNYFFAVAFALEVFLRYTAAGPIFFSETSNWFDAFLVVSSVVEIVAASLEEGAKAPSSDLAGLRVIRMVRICRLLRLLRIARIVRVIRPLRMLVHSIFSTLKSLVWALILLGIIIYTFSIIFTQSITDYLEMEEAHGSPDLTGRLVDDWGQLSTAMFTLYLIVTNGRDWHELVGDLSVVDGGLVAVILVYISFITFAVLNVLTGVFCQTAIESAQHDRDLMMQSMLQNREEFLERVKYQFGDMFHIFEEGGREGVNFREFETHINDPSVQAYLALMELNSTDAWGLFQLLGNDETNTVDVEDFVDGCLRLKGNARSIDLALMRKESRIQVRKLRKEIQEDLQAVASMIGTTIAEVHRLKEVSLTTLTTVGMTQPPFVSDVALSSYPEEDARPAQPQDGNLMCPGASFNTPALESAWKRDIKSDGSTSVVSVGVLSLTGKKTAL